MAWDRSRRQTDPLIREPLELVPCNRHSIDSTFKPQNSRRPNLFTFTSNHSSSLSSDSFSNPGLADFSPRKFNTPLASPARKGHSSIPTLHLHTPWATRDPDSPSPSTVSANNNYTTSSRNSRATPLPPVSSSINIKPVFTKEPKSPHPLKRSPASRSSHGIETSSGPPPALSTRKRSVAQDKSLQSDTKTETPRGQKPSKTVVDQESNSKFKPTTNANADMNGESQIDPEKGRTLRSSLPARMSGLMRTKDKSSPTSTQHSINNYTTTINGDGSMKDDAATDQSSRESGTESKSEDLFLNIARTTSTRRNSGPRTERRRSKFGLTGLSSRPRTVEETPSPEREVTHMTPPFTQDNSPLGSYGTTSTIRSPSSAHPLDETGRIRYFGAGSRSSIGAPRSRLSHTHREKSPEPPKSSYATERRDSVNDQTQHRTYRPSILSGSRTTPALAGSDVTERTRPDVEKYKAEGTESTLSTTAPSTVWDELDDLKSRIWKLELTGKFPGSSAAAMSTISGERPRTATTTVTTLSSSPKRGRKASTPPPEPESAAAPSQIHPLLHTALAKAKPMLSPEVYNTLEATAADALNLASMLNSNSSQLGSSTMSTVSVSGSSASDRQLRRKADNMCRSLTELCIALSNEQFNSISKPRPGSRDAASNSFHGNGVETESTTPTIGYSRGASHEPEDTGRRHTSYSRDTHSHRLDSRRASMLNLSTSSNHTIRGTQENSGDQTIQLSTPPQRMNRSSTIYRSRRPQEEEFDDQPQIKSRPLSRAVTDINHSGSKDRYSREYIPSKPTPEHESVPQQEQTPYQRSSKPHTPTTSQSAIPLRRTYMSTTSNLPTTSHVTIQPGFRRYGAAGGNTGSGTQVDRTPVQHTNNSPRDEPQQPRTASHYSSLQQLRTRTNSLGTRRIGIRQRPLTAIPNGVTEQR